MPTPPASPVRYPCRCLRCGHEWEARKPKPAACASCGSTVWDRVLTTGEERGTAKLRAHYAAVREERAAAMERIAKQVEVERLNSKLLTKGGKLIPGDTLFVREVVAL